MTDKILSFRDTRPEQMEAYLAKLHRTRHPISLIAGGLTDPRNLGMLFRLADAARLAHLWLYQTAPELLESRKVKRIARNTLDYVPHGILSTTEEVSQVTAGCTIVGLEITEQSIPLSDYSPSQQPIALILGNEQQGMLSELLPLCEQCVHIPMYGVNTSMNVAMAAGIAVYSLLENNKSCEK